MKQLNKAGAPLYIHSANELLDIINEEGYVRMVQNSYHNYMSHQKEATAFELPWEEECVDDIDNGAFIVELEDFIKSSDIDYWIYRHSHYNVDIQIGKTQCVSNQLGYVFHNEHVTFDPGKVIEV